MIDAFDLDRFIKAQAGSYEKALAEIQQCRKHGHWMWFIFPQLRGLGRSETAHFYGIASLKEAEAYLAYPSLGDRLRTCISALQDLSTSDAEEVFGSIDAMKLRSCLTLFIQAGGGSLFQAALARWFGGEEDTATLLLLDKAR